MFAKAHLPRSPVEGGAGTRRRPAPRGAAFLLSAGKESGRRHRAGTENGYYDEFMELTRTDHAAFAGSMDAVLKGGGEECRKVAALRALYDTAPERASEAFTWAISSLPRIPGGGTVSVPAFAVAFLCGRVSSDARAREILERVALAEPWRTAPEMRRQAAAALLACATLEDLHRYEAYPPYSVSGSALAEGALFLASAAAGSE